MYNYNNIYNTVLQFNNKIIVKMFQDFYFVHLVQREYKFNFHLHMFKK